MEKITLSVIKADSGGSVGHASSHPNILVWCFLNTFTYGIIKFHRCILEPYPLQIKITGFLLSRNVGNTTLARANQILSDHKTTGKECRTLLCILKSKNSALKNRHRQRTR